MYSTEIEFDENDDFSEQSLNDDDDGLRIFLQRLKNEGSVINNNVAVIAGNNENKNENMPVLPGDDVKSIDSLTNS